MIVDSAVGDCFALVLVGLVAVNESKLQPLPQPLPPLPFIANRITVVSNTATVTSSSFARLFSLWSHIS